MSRSVVSRCAASSRVYRRAEYARTILGVGWIDDRCVECVGIGTRDHVIGIPVDCTDDELDENRGRRARRMCPCDGGRNLGRIDATVVVGIERLEPTKLSPNRERKRLDQDHLRLATGT